MSAATLFVAGAHTEIGKTHVACALLRAARAQSLQADAVKPVVSGFDEADWAQSDPGRLLAALGEPLTARGLDRLSPWRFAAPLAPPAAARLEGRGAPFEEIAAFVRRRIAESAADLVVVEGVGGLMSPIADGATSLDLMARAGGPCVLVVGCYLGAVSHGLTAHEVLRSRGRTPVAVIVSERGAADDLSLASTLELVRAHIGGTPLEAAPRGDGSWAAGVVRQVMESAERSGA